MRNFKPIQRLPCPIHNGTFKNFERLSSNQISMMLILKTDYFQLSFLFKSDFPFSSVEKHVGILEVNAFKPRKTTILFTLFIR